MITPGQQVRLKGTDRRYTVLSIYCTYPFKPDCSAEWCRLCDGSPYDRFWMANQLEPITGETQ